MPRRLKFSTCVVACLSIFLGMFACAGPLVANDGGGLQVLAYVGPGAGLGMIGSLLAVLVTIFIAIFGLVLYPITLIRKMLRKPKEAQATEPDQAAT